MTSSLRAFVKPVLRHLLAPPQCEACEAPLPLPGDLCGNCEGQLLPLRTTHCTVCALPFAGSGLSPHWCGDCLSRPPTFQKVGAAFEFSGTAEALLHAGKFGGNIRALQILCREGRRAFAHRFQEFQPDGVMPVPLSWRRRFFRGFNQSYLAARMLLKETGQGVPVWLGARRRHTEAQAKKSRGERLASLKGVFSISPATRLQKAKVLIIDDVLTTGATAEALSRELLKAGAGEVQVFVLARVGRRVL